MIFIESGFFLSYLGQVLNIDCIDRNKGEELFMDNMNINKEAIRVKTLINEQFAEQSIEADITLPEYYQDIVRVLKCSVYPVINSVAVSGETVTADGIAYLKIVYAGEEQNIYCYEMSYPFSKSMDINGLNDSCKVLTSARLDSCNCRAVNGRRFDIRGAIRLCFQVLHLRELGAVEKIEGWGIQLQKKEKNMLSTVNICEKPFLVEENLDLPENLPSVLRVLRCQANPVVNEVKVISNKIMLKGEAFVNLLYVPDEGGTELQQARFSVVFNEILEVPEIEEGHICDLILYANAADAEVKSKTNAEARSLGLSLRMTARITVSEVKTMTTAADSYSTEYDVEIEREKVQLVKGFEQIDENHISKANLDLSDLSPERILDVFVLSTQHSTALEGQKAMLKGEILLGILYSTSDGELGYREKGMDLLYEKECMEQGEKLLFEPAVSVLAVNQKYAENSLEVKVELLVKGSLFLLDDDEVITAVNVLEDTRREKEQGGLVIYYADKHERLWDIARKYNISSEMLKAENKLDTDVLDESCTLLIPCI